jgi:cell division protein ZapA (FtsZ GTPase activity inhibitor)
MQKNLKVSIFGKNYLVATDEPDAYVLSAAQLVDTAMKGKAEKAPLVNEGRLAMVTALEFATELVKSQQMVREMEEKIEHLNQTLDVVIR